MPTAFNDVYDGSPLFFFDENIKDLEKSFWSCGENLVWPCLNTNPIDSVAQILVDSDRATARRLRAFLDGDCITMDGVEFLCRVSNNMVPDQGAAEALCAQLFKRRFKGKDGFFQRPFMRTKYEVVCDSVTVTRHVMDQLPIRYAYLYDPNENDELRAYSTLLEFHYDIRLQLIRPLPRLTPEDVEEGFIYENGDSSIYQAVEYFLSHPDKLILDRERHKLFVRPTGELLNDRLFLDMFFNSLNLDAHTVACILMDFSNDAELAKKMKWFVEFISVGDRYGSCYYHFETGFSSNRYGYLFENYIQLALLESFIDWDAVEQLYQVCDAIHRVIKTPMEQADDCVRVVKSFRGTSLRLKTIGQYALKSKKIRSTTPEQIRQDYETFKEKLNEIHTGCYAVLTYIKNSISRSGFYEDLKKKLGEMITTNIKCDPFSYTDHDNPIIRNYANFVASGEY